MADEYDEVNDDGDGEQYDPSAYRAPDVVADLDEMSEDEKLRVAAAEMAGKNRKTVLAAAGVEDGVRLDASGRRLNAWETSPKPVDAEADAEA